MKYRLLFLFFICWSVSTALTSLYAQVRTGAEQTGLYLHLLRGKHVSLVVNQTSLIGKTHLLDSLLSQNIQVTSIFAPEHGIRGEADAGAIVKDGKDARSGIPVLSLHGKDKKPRNDQLKDTDIIVFDIQDVGARFFTYISTLYYVMQACAENGKELIVLDRPNPCDYIDGPVLQPKFKSFVGMLPIPVLHGCTVGEIAQMINGEGWLGNGLHCRLRIIPVAGWHHGQPYSLPVKPSPNLPNDQAVALYASLCPFEGTSVSIGRGTPFPFQVIGNPTLKTCTFRFMPRPLKGSDMNPLHKNTYCYGSDLRHTEAPEGFSLKYILEIYRLYRNNPKGFFTRPHWFDLLMGTDSVRMDILKGKSEAEIRTAWQPALQQYKTMRKNYLLYHDYTN